MRSVWITIPEAIQPLDRGDRFDLPLVDELEAANVGDVVGGGSLVRDGTIAECNIELEIADIETALPIIRRVLRAGNAPSGTTIQQRSPELIDYSYDG
ncbi:hypothetical protein FHS27_006372 [Rhodopirellula rubra]|uniref:Uncharacterized protein n=1 Tax=Aporhodopirellula rubra TaxID=980271 RepID=A0A7W5E5H8_9BACT|nr:hypothetical protein [Aporhodopirellula rubra]MBB3210525.1 hypothetical protein [Aporhodopirellula rubra]